MLSDTIGVNLIVGSVLWYSLGLKLFTCHVRLINYLLFFSLLMQRLFEIFHNLSVQVYSKLERTIPGFSTIMEKVQVDAAAKAAKRKEKRTAQQRVEEEMALFGRAQK